MPDATSLSFHEWPARLDAAAAATGGRITRVHAVREVGSTQDEARRLRLRPGEVVVAWRQTAGRGRLGRAWADTVEEGVALTVALPPTQAARLALLGAVAAATAIEAVLAGWAAHSAGATAASGATPRVGIKWPNDIVFGGRKLAGVLVEQVGGVALMGIGVNVLQQRWPDSLADTATSVIDVVTALHPCRDTSAVQVDRIDVIGALLHAIAKTGDDSDEALIAEFRARDSLTGALHTLRCGDEKVVGTIVEIDPLRSLRVQRVDGSTVSLPAALARIEK